MLEFSSHSASTVDNIKQMSTSDSTATSSGLSGMLVCLYQRIDAPQSHAMPRGGEKRRP